jgi:hypothetical protein
MKHVKMSYHKNKYVKYVFNIYAENDQKINCIPGYEDDGIEQLCPLVGMVFDDLWTDVGNHGNSDSDVEIRWSPDVQQRIDNFPDARSIRRCHHLVLVSNLTRLKKNIDRLRTCLYFAPSNISWFVI